MTAFSTSSRLSTSASIVLMASSSLSSWRLKLQPGWRHRAARPDADERRARCAGRSRCRRRVVGHARAVAVVVVQSRVVPGGVVGAGATHSSRRVDEVVEHVERGDLEVAGRAQHVVRRGGTVLLDRDLGLRRRRSTLRLRLELPEVVAVVEDDGLDEGDGWRRRGPCASAVSHGKAMLRVGRRRVVDVGAVVEGDAVRLVLGDARRCSAGSRVGLATSVGAMQRVGRVGREADLALHLRSPRRAGWSHGLPS